MEARNERTHIEVVARVRPLLPWEKGHTLCLTCTSKVDNEYNEDYVRSELPGL
jgi:hypothetical protein